MTDREKAAAMLAAWSGDALGLICHLMKAGDLEYPIGDDDCAQSLDGHCPCHCLNQRCCNCGKYPKAR